MNKFYYSVGSGSRVYEYTDDYAYDINDGLERESLAICLANDYYSYNGGYGFPFPKIIHLILLDPKTKKQLYSYNISHCMEPVFEVDEEIKRNG